MSEKLWAAVDGYIFWQDGRVARMSTTLNARDLRAASLFTSRSGGGF